MPNTTDHERGVLHLTGPMEASKKMEGPSEPLAGPLDEAKNFLLSEAAFYGNTNGQLDGIPFASVAHICHVMAKRVGDLAATHSAAPAEELERDEDGVVWVKEADAAALAASPAKPEAAVSSTGSTCQSECDGQEGAFSTSGAPSAKPEAAPVVKAEWEDPKVQVVYKILCDTETSPPPEEHWEGFLARRIVAALHPAVAKGGDHE